MLLNEPSFWNMNSSSYSDAKLQETYDRLH